jgi:hypothetical protein
MRAYSVFRVLTLTRHMAVLETAVLFFNHNRVSNCVETGIVQSTVCIFFVIYMTQQNCTLILKFHLCLMAEYKLLSWRPTQEHQDGLEAR